MLPRYLDAQAAAEYLSISRSTLDLLVDRGVLPKPRELTPRVKRWDREAIDKAIAAGQVDDPGQSTTDIARSIADDIVAQRRLSPAKGARRRVRDNVLPLSADR